jgi:hypothetical protein
VGCWVYITELVDNYDHPTILILWDASNYMGIDINYISPGVFKFRGATCIGGNLQTIVNVNAIQKNTWYYIGFSYDATNSKFYLVVNNIIQSYTTTGSWAALSASYNTFYVAHYVSGVWRHRSYMDELMFYQNKFLNPNLLAQHYTHGVAWETSYSKADILIRPNTDGRLFSEYQIKSTCGVDAPYAEFSFEEAVNVLGGTATTGAWRKLTDSAGNITTVSNSIPGLSVAAGVFSIPACTLDIIGYHTFYATNLSRIRLYDLTHSLVLLKGSNGRADTTYAGSYDSKIIGRIVIASPITAQFDYRVGLTCATYGLGVATNWTDKEQYGNIIFRKVA